jgi:hypothetical protein
VVADSHFSGPALWDGRSRGRCWADEGRVGFRDGRETRRADVNVFGYKDVVFNAGAQVDSI